MEIINVSYPNDGLGDKLRDSMVKVNDNFNELLGLINSLDLSISGITGLDDALNTISASITGLQSQINAIDSNHTTDISTINSNVTTINSSIATINDAIAEILNQLEPLFEPTLQSTFLDSNLGTMLTPISSTINGFNLNKSVNGSVGLVVKNTNVAGNGAIAAVSVGGTGSYYENSLSLTYYGGGYYIPSLRKTGGLYSTQDFNFLNVNNSKIDFRTGNTISDVTSKFSISGGGTISIGVTPSTDNSVTKGLARKTNGDIVEFTIPSGSSTPTLQTVTTAGNVISATVSSDNITNTIQANQIRLRNVTQGAPIVTMNMNGYSVSSFTGLAVYGATTLTSAGIAHSLPNTSNAGKLVTVGTTAPASASATGEVGEIRVTSTYIYTCIATDTWVRSVAATW